MSGTIANFAVPGFSQKNRATAVAPVSYISITTGRRWFFAIVAISVLLVAAWLYLRDFMDPVEALRYSTFNVISVMTGSGFVTADYGRWGSFAVTVMFIVTFIGGCAGSTTCGIKIFRLQVLYATITDPAEQQKLFELYRGAFAANLGVSFGTIAADFSQ